MNSTLEEQRALHEERDRIEKAVVDEMLAKKVGQREKLDSEHKQKALIERYMEVSSKLLKLYEIKFTEPFCSDIDANPFAKFSSDCKKLMDYYQNDQDELLIAEQIEVANKVNFTNEEGNGRYLDLVKSYESYLQVVKEEECKLNYIEFLDQLNKLTTLLPRERKIKASYKNFLNEILTYFRDFCKRAKPLINHEELEQQTKADFEKRLLDCDVSDIQIDLDSFKSSDELLEFGLDCLKRELQARGLKCGGTLRERANRLWSVKGKNKKIPDTIKANEVSIDVTLLEQKLIMFADLFYDHRKATIENVQRRQARTAEEREDESDDASDVDIDDDEDEDNQNDTLNPKNLPLGWDGKPIPYWLYKLHGLNLAYTCEICGNAVYKGPKAFQRHFAESRHAQGMQALGIPNTAHFANITQIEDACNLWGKLKVERKKQKFNDDSEEEYEDSLGNVVNKKTYLDLQRQGLL